MTGKRSIIKAVFCLITLIAVRLLFEVKIAVAADFDFDYEVTYTVKENGLTSVTHDVTITNQTSTYYAQNYSLIISSERLEKVVASDDAGLLSPQVVVNSGQTRIFVPFTAKTVGLGSKYSFRIDYQSSNIAVRKGRIWEVIIPGVDEDDKIHSYLVRLNVPKSFAEPAYLTPAPGSDGVWNLGELAGQGITAAYGQTQAYSFNLLYHLENSTSAKQLQEITLPPQTAYQDIFLWRLSPPPQNVRLDVDGNWLGVYELEPKESKRIIAEGSALVYAIPREGFAEPNVSSQLYTREQAYWEFSPEIAKVAETLKTPRAIYDYVVNTLTYSYDRLEPGITRLGANKALENPTQAVCMEFSDLFVALSRKSGIPAREVHGYASTNNERLQPLSLVTDVLHAWVEYYDQERQIWIAVDPTWGNTTKGVDYFSKFDFNHLTFAILGEHSDYPYPAGSFRGDTPSKDVFVEFLEEIPQTPKTEIKIELEKTDSYHSGGVEQTNILIRNVWAALYKPKGSLEIKGDVKLVTDL
ncbi:MAG: transglutaminase domain-containing protein, partial [Patescibacteria group bacterium]